LVDRNKVLENAQKLVAKGSYDKAIAQYQLLVDDDPRDVRTLLKIGDLHTKTGARDRAVESYGRVATQYANQGFFLKAVAVYKQILKLDPSSIDSQLKLASMYEQLDLVSDALTTYEQVAAHYARAGDLNQAIATLGRMAELDPENIPVRIKYAEALSKVERTEEAAKEFEAGANLLREQGRMDDYLKVAERLLFHRPDVAVSREVAEMYLERNDAKRALSKLQVCFQANPKDVATLELLARAFHVLGQHAKTISVYREIARVYQDGKRPAERERVLRKILELDPNDDEAKTALGQKPPQARDASSLFEVPPGTIMAPPSSGGAPSAETRLPKRTIVQEPEAPADSLSFDDDGPEMEFLDDDIDDVEDDAEILIEPDSDEESEPAIFLDDDNTPPPSHVPAEPVAQVAPAPQPQPEAVYAEQPFDADEPVEGYAGFVDPAVWPEVERLMSEVESFLRFGLLDKAQAQLEHIVNLAPDYMLARQMLSDVYQQNGMLDDSIQQLLDMALICSQIRPDLSVMYLDAVLDLDPINIDARIMLGRVSVPAATAEVAELAHDAPLEPHPEERISVSSEQALDPLPPAAAPQPDDDDAGVLFMDEPDSAPHIQVSEAAPVPAPESVRTRPSVPPPERVASVPPLGVPSVVPDKGLSEYPDALTIAPPGAPTSSRFDSEIPDAPTVQRDVTPEALVATAADPELDELLAPAPTAPEESVAAEAAAAPEALAEPEPEPEPEEEEAAEEEEVPEEVAEGLEEAEFFVAQGLYDDALASLEDLREEYPDSAALAKRIAEIRAASEGPAEELADESFALAEKLAEELEEEPPAAAGSDILDVEQVFAQFKKGVEEQVDEADSDTHFDLGIAYKEMGLLDDAISEFQVAMRNPVRECSCNTMVGLCRMEQGRTQDAINSFRAGLHSENKNEREELALYFELANAYEILGDSNEALYFFEKVRKRDAVFRGVSQRIRKVQAAMAAASEPDASDEDELDAAFDDLLSDD
jgi:pilus assembly protein FimV